MVVFTWTVTFSLIKILRLAWPRGFSVVSSLYENNYKPCCSFTVATYQHFMALHSMINLYFDHIAKCFDIECDNILPSEGTTSIIHQILRGGHVIVNYMR